MIQINQNQKRKFLIQAVLLKKTDYNTNITEIEGKIPDVSSLATKTALTTVEIKYLMIAVQLRKRIKTLKLQKLKINLIILIMINILQLQSLILQLLMSLMQDYHE